MDFESKWTGTLIMDEDEHTMLVGILEAAKAEDLKTLQLYKRDIVEFIKWLMSWERDKK